MEIRAIILLSSLFTSLVWADYDLDKLYGQYEVTELSQGPLAWSQRANQSEKVPYACERAFGKTPMTGDLLELSRGQQTSHHSVYETVDLSFYNQKRGWIKERAAFRAFIFDGVDSREAVEEKRTLTHQTKQGEVSRHLSISSTFFRRGPGLLSVVTDEDLTTPTKILRTDFVMTNQSDQTARYSHCNLLSDECCEISLVKIKPEAVAQKIKKIEQRKPKKEKLKNIEL